jgi:hypothetical protein
MSGYWGFPGCLRVCFPCLVHGEEALRLNATVPSRTCIKWPSASSFKRADSQTSSPRSALAFNLGCFEEAKQLLDGVGGHISDGTAAHTPASSVAVPHRPLASRSMAGVCAWATWSPTRVLPTGKPTWLITGHVTRLSAPDKTGNPGIGEANPYQPSKRGGLATRIDRKIPWRSRILLIVSACGKDLRAPPECGCFKTAPWPTGGSSVCGMTTQ